MIPSKVIPYPDDGFKASQTLSVSASSLVFDLTEYTKLNGSPAEIEKQKRLLAANSSPAELGAKLYSGCAACHGGNGEGGVGPALVGQTSEEIISKLVAYKNGETRGAQSVLMWGQSAGLSDADMQNLAAYIITF